MTTYYLSDTSFAWFKKEAKKAGVGVGALVERDAAKWLRGTGVELPDDVTQLIRERAEDVARRSGDSVVARNDKRRRTVAAAALYDGVVYRAMFGSWGRQPHDLKLSEETEARLARWLKREKVVQRRAASVHTLCGCALELIGRRWVGRGGG